jgi:transcriptional regulator with XRE-family HTH domain
MTQDQLASKAGFSTADIGLCERGELPLGAGGLFDIAAALDVPVTFFFEGIQGQATGDAEKRATILLEQEAMDLVRAYYALPAGQRKGLLDLAHTLRNAAR